MLMNNSVSFLWLLVIFTVFITYCSCVDRSNFKSCENSGFCKRHRAVDSNASPFFVDPSSLQSDITGLKATLVDGNSGKTLLLSITKLKKQIFKLHLNEQNGMRKRFEVPVGDSVLPNVAMGSVTVENEGDNLVILKSFTDGVKGILQFKPFRFDCLLDDQPVVSVNGRGFLKWEFFSTKPENATNTDGLYEEEFKGHTDNKPHGPSSVGLDISFPGFEFVYGIPEHADTLALKSTVGSTDPYRLYNLDVFEYELNNPMALYGSVPLMYAHNGNNTVGAFWNNPSETWVDIVSSKSSGGTISRLLSFVKPVAQPQTDTHWISESGVIDLYLMMAERPLDAFSQYASLTGTTPLPPQFAIAYHQCRWNYNDEADVLEVDRQFDEHDIPYDVIWLDIEHTDGKRYFTWDNAKFPNPNEMLDKLRTKGRELVTVVDPHIKRDDNWDLYKGVRDGEIAVKNKDNQLYDGWCWPGSSIWPDFIDTKVREWWAGLYKNYITAFSWNDMGEPSVFNGPEVTMHKDAIHHGGIEHREVHNLYGALVHQASWNGQLLQLPNRRPFVLTRAFFAGSQRTSAVWTGDNAAKWDHLKASLPMVMSLSLAGITFGGADVGGFFGNPEPELLVRWYQAGAFQPFFRAHAHLDTKRREPWLLDEEHVSLIRSVIRLRYALLPYWYTQFYLSSLDGRPVMAPLWVYHPQDTTLFGVEDEHLVGPDLLVKPVTDAGATSITVQLPNDGTQWYRADTWELHSPPSVTLSVNLATIPLFYRAGGIISRRDRWRRASSSSRNDPLTLVVCLNASRSAKGQLYLDDGRSLDHINTRSYLLTHLTYYQGSLVNKPQHVGYDTNVAVERIVFVGFKTRPRSITLPGDIKAEFAFSPRAAVVRRPNLRINQNWVVTVQDGSQTGHSEL